MDFMKAMLSQAKKQIITFAGARSAFPLTLLGHDLLVGYSLRSMKPERDYSAILQLAANKKCIFDIGANHGIISLLVASSNPASVVYAFEASEAATNVIKENIELNRLQDSVTIINALVADRSGYVIPFYWEGSSGGASITKGRLGHHKDINKSTLSIDDYVASQNVSPDFIKIDIEGAELLAIIGMEKVLKTSRPDVFVELHDASNKKLYQNAQDILNFISSIDYQMIYLRTGLPVIDCRVMSDRGRCHVLLQPKERYSSNTLEAFDFRGL